MESKKRGINDVAAKTPNSPSKRNKSNVFFGPPVAVDIGGSLAKLVFFKLKNVPTMPSYVKSDSDVLNELAQLPLKLDPNLSIDRPELGGIVKFLRLPSNNVEDFIDFCIKTNLHKAYGNNINITGGGAHKYREIIEKKLGINVRKLDEMEMVVRGLNFLLSVVKNEVFSYNWRENQQIFDEVDADNTTTDVNDATETETATISSSTVPLAQFEHKYYPYLLVNIGSGVSIVKVSGPDNVERVSGSSLGGGTFWGLCRLLCGTNDFEDVRKLSSEGDNSNVDLLVGDIYGGAYSNIGLNADVIASSFGKIATVGDVEKETFEKSDIVRSLLFMISNNIAQIAYLNAERYGTKHVFFAGGFLQRNAYIWHRLAFAVEFWSKGEMEAKFLLHDGYLGAVGAFLENSRTTCDSKGDVE